MNQEILHVAERLARVSTLLAGTDLDSLSAELSQRAERLLNQESTIAVFGAFSAGKSSLINALVGRNLLPVSPNPTTASINRILPPTDVYPHETVRVFMKSAAQIQDEVAQALQ
ncbi:dynamin family protein, partial [Ferroacidibacillus organovorans]